MQSNDRSSNQGTVDFLSSHPEAECSESRFDSPRAARAALARLPLPSDLAGRAAYVLAELANNALLHAGPDFVARFWHDGSWARIEVQDTSPQLPQRRAPGTTTSGRGLVIVNGLSNRWGSYRTDEGKVVWAELS